MTAFRDLLRFGIPELNSQTGDCSIADLPLGRISATAHKPLVSCVQTTIKLLNKLNYTEPNDWSRPLPTGRPNEVMAILTKKVKIN